MTARLIWITVTLAILPCFLPPAPMAVDPPAGAPIIHSEPGDDLPRETRTLAELWHIGSYEDDPVLGMITRVRGDDSGKVYLLDTRQHLVHVLAAEGQYLGSLGREGDGPGEVREPRDLLLMPDGTLGLLQRMPGRIVKIDPDGIPAGTVTITSDAEGGFASLQQIKRSASHLVVLGRYSRPGDGGIVWEYFLAPISDDDRLGPSYTSAQARLGGGSPVFREKDHYMRMFMPWSVGPDRDVYFAPQRELYAVHVCGADGKLKRVIERDFDTAARSAPVRRALNEAFESCVRGATADVEFAIEMTAPAVMDLHIDESGSLWVRHSRSLARTPDGSTLSYDVYGVDGRLQKQVTFVGADISEFDGLYFLPGNRAVLVRDHLFCRLVIDCQGSGSTSDQQIEESGLPLVTCYRID